MPKILNNYANCNCRDCQWFAREQSRVSLCNAGEHHHNWYKPNSNPSTTSTNILKNPGCSTKNAAECSIQLKPPKGMWTSEEDKRLLDLKKKINVGTNDNIIQARCEDVVV